MEIHRPAALLVRVRGDFVSTPATHLHDAVLGLQAFLLGHLLADITTGAAAHEGSDGWTRGKVGQIQRLLVDVESDAGVVRLDVARNADSARGTLVTRRLEEDLSAARVELRVSRGGKCGVQSKKLRPGEVVAALEAGRKVDRELVVVDAVGIGSAKLLVAPEVLLLVIALVPDLEPAVTGACGMSVKCPQAGAGILLPVSLIAESTFFR